MCLSIKRLPVFVFSLVRSVVSSLVFEQQIVAV